MKNFKLALIIFAITTSAFAVNKKKTALVCHQPLTNKGSFTAVAKRLGLEFLMARLKQEDFKAMNEQAGQGDLVLSGINSERYYPMIPLLNRDSGRWAHQLLSCNDCIGMGVRSKAISDWNVGLVFPVELLDQVDFVITKGPAGSGAKFGQEDSFDSKTTAEQFYSRARGRARSGQGFGDNGHTGAVFDSATGTAEEFADALRLITQQEPYAGTTDFIDYFQFRFKKGVPVAAMSFLWIPAPLLNAQNAKLFEKLFPGQELPIDSNGTFSTRISRNIGTEQNTRWLNEGRPPQNPIDLLNTNESIAAWYNVIPLWSEVRYLLDTAPQRRLPRLGSRFN